jgi:hypothetical protein
VRRWTALVLACLLAGCWQSSGSLYQGAKPAQPFHAGKLVSRSPDKPKEVSRSVLALETNGAYRLTNADKGSSDFGDAMLLRLFASPGLPRDMFVFEAVSDDKCKPGDTCHRVTATSERDYGLVRLTKAGAEVTSPGCAKNSAVAKLPGVKLEDYGLCQFSSRASLEAALRIQAGQPWKPQLTYRYE